MASSKTSLLFTLLASICFGPVSAFAEDHLTVLKPYLKPDTFLVAIIDLEEVQPDQLADISQRLRTPLPIPPAAQKIRNSLLEVGVKHAYVVASFLDLFQQRTLLMIPATEDQIEAADRAVTDILASQNPPRVSTRSLATKRHRSNLLVGHPDMLEEVTTAAHGHADPVLAEAIKELAYPSAAFLRLPSDASAFLAPILPDVVNALQLPEKVDVESTIEAANEIQLLSLHYSASPLLVSCSLQASSPTAATTLAQSLNSLIADRLPAIADVTNAKADDNVVTIDLNNEETVRGVVTSIIPSREVAELDRRKLSLKRIGIAFHNFHDIFGRFPPHALAAKNGDRLLSWRVLLLPYIGEKQLYKQFRLDEPWNSEHNRKLIPRIPEVYARKTSPEASNGKTRVVAPLTPHSILGREGSGVRIQHITDGTSNTILTMVVPKDQAVIWTKPEDVVIDKTDNGSEFTEAEADGFWIGLADGFVRTVPKSLPEGVLWQLITINGGEIIGEF